MYGRITKSFFGRKLAAENPQTVTRGETRLLHRYTMHPSEELMLKQGWFEMQSACLEDIRKALYDS